MKTIFKKLKKGFTIVELVIVIAVIAILAAVLIPTLANVLSSANESNDMVLVSNLNKIVAAYDTVGDIDTVNDALDGALENGYSVSNLTPTSEGNVIVYDSLSNRFALLSANALTADATDDDVIYKDTSTTKTDWTDYTTWVFVDASAASNGYVTITASGETYTLSGTNSYILTGTDWNGRSVVANYGLVLFDNTKTITLNSVTVKESTQTGVKADTNSSAKTAISKKTIDNTNSAISIVVNVKAIYLVCTAENYAIDNYSTISISTTIKNCQFNEHGTAAVYDAKDIGSGTINNYNSNIGSVTVNLATDADISNIFVNKTTAAIEVETLINATITISTTESEDGTTTTTLQLGSEKYPYLITGTETDGLMTLTLIDFESKMTDTSSTATVYFKLENDVYVTNDISFSTSYKYGISVDMNKNVIYIVDGKKIELSRTGNWQSFSISNGTITGVNSSYDDLNEASDTPVLYISSTMSSLSITNCIFNQASLQIGKRTGNKYGAPESTLIDSCSFNYTKDHKNYALITFFYGSSSEITITNNKFIMEASNTLYFNSINSSAKITINLKNNKWTNSQLDLYSTITGITLPAYNACYTSEGNTYVDQDKLQSSTTAFIAAASGLIKDRTTYFEINDDGTNIYKIEGQTTRTSSTATITNIVDVWGIIISTNS